MSNPPIIPTPPIIRESRVTLYLIVSCGKHLCQSLFFSQVADPRLLRLCGYRKCFSSHPAFRSLVQKWNIYSDQKKITVKPFKGRVLTLFIMESMSYLLVTYMCMDFLVTFFKFCSNFWQSQVHVKFMNWIISRCTTKCITLSYFIKINIKHLLLTLNTNSIFYFPDDTTP